MTIRLTELNSETEWDPDRASGKSQPRGKYRPLLPKHNWLFSKWAGAQQSWEFERKRLLLISRLVFGL
jgi:hypothetical protein